MVAADVMALQDGHDSTCFLFHTLVTLNWNCAKYKEKYCVTFKLYSLNNIC